MIFIKTFEKYIMIIKSEEMNALTLIRISKIQIELREL